ncbi:DEAD/DEAH box helicase [bacterium]|nr:DEAD/DEAH box helicase [bacterium]
MSLNEFHPAVANWFTKTFSQPTEIQSLAWPAIKRRRHTLIAAPTGSGKTLASFLATIDDLIQQGLQSPLPNQTMVVYVSPLKALSNDIEKNLQRPLEGIEEELTSMQLPRVELRTMVRTGDTPASERTAMLKHPPHILVTTPESLFLLLTSENGRKMLHDVHTVIVDEIHALVRDKRGTHLALSLERLQALVQKPLTRIGISATQKPIEAIADFLVGIDQAAPQTQTDSSASLKDRNQCTIINTGHKRNLELGIEVPRSPLTAVMSTEVWEEIYIRLEELIAEHRTTLIFVNTRRLAERIAHYLTEKLGPETITAHHGSMSREQRLDAEQRLKSGALRALVATASLELGIDIGSVDLVCQIGSPKSIATFLQRVGRSGHSVTGTPKGRIFPLTRDELVECASLFDAIRRGELDHIIIPEKPVDILAQQIVAEVAAQEWHEDELFELFRRAYPYRNLTRKEFDETIEMLVNGFTTRRGKRGAYLFNDVVNKRLRARKGSRLAAITSGGAIPDTFDYDVILEPTNTFIGTLNEDFAFEASVGDIFQLGNKSWQILRVENGVVRVADAGMSPPSIPFWLGEAPGRSIELSYAVSRFRDEVASRFGNLDELLAANSELSPDSSTTLKDRETAPTKWRGTAPDWLVNEVGIHSAAADQIVTYLALAKTALGVIPSQTTIVLERFFDEAGDMHLIIHSPFGSRLNRAWGLSLRKKFCRKFNFELQAAATEDAIILSLGSTHSFPVDEVFTYLNSKIVRPTLVQAVFDSPMFEIRWRWNATRSLAMLRRRDGKKVPAQIQRMNAQDLVALVFPDQLACLENIAGDREVPDHPLVNQTIEDCLFEAMDVGELENLFRRIEANEIKLVAKDLREPSPLAQEILNARPYAFLDDAPIEERRARAVMSRRWLDPSEAADLGKLDPLAIELVCDEVWPEVENADELHDALTLLGFLTEQEIAPWKNYFDELASQKRATIFQVNQTVCYLAIERVQQFKAIFDNGHFTPELNLPEKLLAQSWTREDALTEIIRGRLEGLGPVTASKLALSVGLPASDIDQSLLKLEVEGFAFRGKFKPDALETEWCERRILARIHRYTLEKLRKEIEAVSPADFMRFLFSWQHVDPAERLEGQEALNVVLNQLEGFEAAAAAWESDILPARITDYDFTWLDFACLSGRTAWGRFRVNGSGRGPVKSTPIMLVQRTNLETWKHFSDAPKEILESLSHTTKKVYEFLVERGASFYHDIVDKAGVLKSQAEEAIAELVALGIVTSDSFTGLRALLVPAKYKLASAHERGKKQAPFTMDQAGRWGLLLDNSQVSGSLSAPASDKSNMEIEFTARLLLRRYGVVFRKLAEREAISPPWRELAKIYRKLEARGEIRGGRFVEGVWGEQFALPEAVTKLRSIKKEQKTGKLISISASDPLNLHGVITVEKRVSNIAANRILYRDGVPVALLDGKDVTFLENINEPEKWPLQNVLVQRPIPPKLRSYLGKGIA